MQAAWHQSTDHLCVPAINGVLSRYLQRRPLKASHGVIHPWGLINSHIPGSAPLYWDENLNVVSTAKVILGLADPTQLKKILCAY